MKSPLYSGTEGIHAPSGFAQVPLNIFHILLATDVVFCRIHLSKMALLIDDDPCRTPLPTLYIRARLYYRMNRPSINT